MTILKPLAEYKPKQENAELSEKEKLNLQFHYAAWRFHLWGKNYGSYNQIEKKIRRGILTPFVCPDAKCDCDWKKKTEFSNGDPDSIQGF